jgi:hypothetical protein
MLQSRVRREKDCMNDMLKIYEFLAMEGREIERKREGEKMREKKIGRIYM